LTRKLIPPSTPIARSKTAALSRILDSVPKGYQRYTTGMVSAAKADLLANKFHARYCIDCSPAQRLTRKAKGLANAVLVMYWPEGADEVRWILLATAGIGLESEKLWRVDEKPRLSWLGYELVRYSSQGRTSWTWRRPREEIAELHALVAHQVNAKHLKALEETLERIARQPGFSGVRAQSWALCQEARRRGYSGHLPHLFSCRKSATATALNSGPVLIRPEPEAH
jgi:hypothetical protein